MPWLYRYDHYLTVSGTSKLTNTFGSDSGAGGHLKNGGLNDLEDVLCCRPCSGLLAEAGVDHITHSCRALLWNLHHMIHQSCNLYDTSNGTSLSRARQVVAILYIAAGPPPALPCRGRAKTADLIFVSGATRRGRAGQGRAGQGRAGLDWLRLGRLGQ